MFVLAGVAIAACAHDDSTMFITGVLAPKTVSNGQGCVYTSDPTQTMIPTGTLDVALRHQYDAEFLVASQIVPRANPSAPSPETSYVQIQGGVVRITDSQGNELKSFTRLTSGTINPGSSGSPSYSPVNLTLLDQDTVESPGVIGPVLAGEIKRLVAYVHVFGTTLGGQSVESGEFAFPIDLCYTCLIGFTQANDDPNPLLPQPNCYGNAGNSTASGTVAETCAPGQDSTLDCTLCPGVPECRTVRPASPPTDGGAG
jgi:hypothetical protein